MSPPVVADTGPLITFARADQLGLLRVVLPEILIPLEVFNELTRTGSHRPGAREAIAGDWLRTCPLTDKQELSKVSSTLHAGEREAIALALERRAILLIDEDRGRTEAKALGLVPLTSLLILKQAKETAVLAAVRPVLASFRAAGFFLTDDFAEAFLQELGEG